MWGHRERKRYLSSSRPATRKKRAPSCLLPFPHPFQDQAPIAPNCKRSPTQTKVLDSRRPRTPHPTMRSFLASIWLSASLATIVSAAAVEQPQAPIPNSKLPSDFYTSRNPQTHWDYTGVTGPILWSKLNKREWPLCSTGDLQSPINVDHSMKPSGFKYQWAAPMRACYNMTNLGNMIELTPTCGGNGGSRNWDDASTTEDDGDAPMAVQIDNDWFNLKSIQFHTPSEHRFLDEYFPLEAHFVMQSPTTSKFTLNKVLDVFLYKLGSVANVSPARALRHPRNLL